MKLWVKILIALITAGGAIAAAYIANHKIQPLTHTFTCIVRGSNQAPVSGAKVNVFHDESSQTSYTDADGVVHFLVRNEEKYLKISVEAAGFIPASKDTDPNRTGPEEISLQPLPKTSAPATPAKPNIGTSGEKSPIIIGNGNNLLQ